MRRTTWFAALTLLAGCIPDGQDRLRAYVADGVYLYQRGDYLHARETFQAALAMAPDDPTLQFNLAQCYERLGQADRAEDIYRRCLQQHPENADCRHALAVLLVRSRRRDEAVEMTQEWLRQAPRSADAYALDGWLWHDLGDLPRAQGRLQQALALDPRNRRALNELALVYEALNRPDRALVLYERSLAVDAHQPEVARKIQQLRDSGVKYPAPDWQ